MQAELLSNVQLNSNYKHKKALPTAKISNAVLKFVKIIVPQPESSLFMWVLRIYSHS